MVRLMVIPNKNVPIFYINVVVVTNVFGILLKIYKSFDVNCVVFCADSLSKVASHGQAGDISRKSTNSLGVGGCGVF